MNNRVFNFLLLQFKNMLLILLVSVLGSMLIRNKGEHFFMSAEAARLPSANQPQLVALELKINRGNPAYIHAVELRVGPSDSLPVLDIQVSGSGGPIYRCSESPTRGSWTCLTPGLLISKAQQFQLKVTQTS